MDDDFPMIPIPLVGEGFDRAFETPSGNRFRVKVRQTAANRAFDHAAPTGLTLSITLALLDEENAVQKTGGAFRIFDPHEISIDAAGMAHPGLDIGALITASIARQAKAAEAMIDNHAVVARILEDWGISPVKTEGG